MTADKNEQESNNAAIIAELLGTISLVGRPKEYESTPEEINVDDDIEKVFSESGEEITEHETQEVVQGEK
jgi:hypothetical protein